jgi:hypothetical protein
MREADGSRTKVEDDEHNEVCEECDMGGNLLCCDTCTLVFHKNCLRPPHTLSKIPTGIWSCPECVDSGVGSNSPVQKKSPAKIKGVTPKKKNQKVRVEGCL